MSRKRLLILTCVGLVLISCVLAARVWSPALSAAAACRQLMEHTEGYGPWHVQAAPPVAQTSASGAVVTYFDGFNTAIVVGVGQTMVGCSRGLSAAGEEACPRGTYGVIP